MSLTKSNPEGTKSNNKIFNDLLRKNIDFFIKEDKIVAKKSNTQCKDSNIIFFNSN